MTYPPGALAADGQLVAVAQESVVYNSVAVGGLTGVPLSCRLMGGNTSGPPASGTFSQLDIAVDGTGAAWICTAAGTPGTWVQAGTVLARASAPAVVALTDGASIAVNAALGNDFRVTLGGNRTIAAPSNPVDGQVIRFQLTQDATGSRTITWTSTAGGFDFGTPGAPTLTTTAAKTDMVRFAYNATIGKWLYDGSNLGN